MTHPETSDPTRAGRAAGPLSTAQERLWFIDAAAPGSAAYNVPYLLRWRDRIDVPALAAALTAVVTRHEVLRTVYVLRDGRPEQVVREPQPVIVADRPGVPDRAALDAEARAPFDLAAGPPIRCAVWRGGSDGDLMLLTVHHIAVDGWSLVPLFEDLASAYEDAAAGRAPHLPGLPMQYLDYAVWEKSACDAPEPRARLAERAEQLRGYPGGLVLGGGKPRRPVPEGARRGEQHVFTLDRGSWTAVLETAIRLRATPYAILFAAFQVVVQRWSGRESFLIGTVAVDRPAPALEGLVGFFVNTVPLRCDPDPSQSFDELCLQARAEAFRALRLSRLPFDRLSAAAAAQRLQDGSGGLVDVGFGLQNMPVPRTSELWRTPELLPTGSAKFSLLLLLEERPDGVHGIVEYDLDLYDAPLAALVAEHFQVVLGAALADPARPVCRLPLTRHGSGSPHPGVAPGERRDLLAERLTAAGHAGGRS